LPRLGELKTRVIKPFDPWRSRLCTCPPKLTLDPYTGCEHGCLYCYASSYVKDFYHCRPKRNLIQMIRRDLTRIPDDTLVSISNSSDPYPPMEGRLRLTRRCLEELSHRDLRILIVTKGDVILGDLDLLQRLRVAVTMTITTLDNRIAERMEPKAPEPSRRLEVIEELTAHGIPVGLRLDPIIPGINDSTIEELVTEAREAGVSHVVSSTFKPRWDSWLRVNRAFPEMGEELRALYFEEGERVGRSWYLSRRIRHRLMRRVGEACRKLGLTFATCREGLPRLNMAPTCDGSHLIWRRLNRSHRDLGVAAAAIPRLGVLSLHRRWLEGPVGGQVCVIAIWMSRPRPIIVVGIAEERGLVDDAARGIHQDYRFVFVIEPLPRMRVHLHPRG
jgi:DNA repair photolyase